VLDDVQVSFSAGRMATVKSVARRTVERLGPADLAGVLTTSGRLGGQAEFTTDKSRLFEAIERFVPQGEHDLPAGYYSPAPANDGRHHRITVRTRVPDVEIRARQGYDSPGRAAKALAAAPLEVLARYQIRVAAAGGDKSQGSVFMNVSVPKFDAELAVGGLSLGAPSALAVTEADRRRGVLALIPLATNEIAPGSAVAAQLPIRVSPKAASNPLTITATLLHAGGRTLLLDRTHGAGRDYASAGGKVYRVALPDALAGGSYRVTVESTLGRTTVAREVAFSVLSRP